MKEFQFEDSGRTYTCCVEESRTSPSTKTAPWWWFRVSNDDQRYAPFQAAPGDTRESVRARIVAFYNHRLERKAAPPEHYRGRRPTPTGTSAAPAAPGGTATAEPQADADSAAA